VAQQIVAAVAGQRAVTRGTKTVQVTEAVPEQSERRLFSKRSLGRAEDVLSVDRVPRSVPEGPFAEEFKSLSARMVLLYHRQTSICVMYLHGRGSLRPIGFVCACSLSMTALS